MFDEKQIDDISEFIGEMFHTGLRKWTDSNEATTVWKTIQDMPDNEWNEICKEVATELIKAFPMTDIRDTSLSLKISSDGKTLWINTPEKCIFRAQNIPCLLFEDLRYKKGDLTHNSEVCEIIEAGITGNTKKARSYAELLLTKIPEDHTKIFIKSILDGSYKNKPHLQGMETKS